MPHAPANVDEYLAHHPECLEKQVRDATLLFADLRGFTQVADRLSPAQCYQLLSEVMQPLGNIVGEHLGAVVDFYGDGVLALWNAPLDQADHAELACHAALDMFPVVEQVSHRWRSKIHTDLQLGVGIHTGPVAVGNVGTRQQAKYGPRGVNVNLTSRVQAATRVVNVPLLVTGPVQKSLSESLRTWRVCTARLDGVEHAVELYLVVHSTVATHLQSDLEHYTQALAAFEQGQLGKALALLDDHLRQSSVVPARFLANHVGELQRLRIGRRADDPRPVVLDGTVPISAK